MSVNREEKEDYDYSREVGFQSWRKHFPLVAFFLFLLPKIRFLLSRSHTKLILEMRHPSGQNKGKL